VQVPGETHTQAGNGLTIVDETFDPVPSYVLGAGLSYDLGLQYTLSFDLTGAPAVYPTIVVTLESGGISEFSGFSVDFNAVTVPEPALASLAPSLLLAAIHPLRRRYR
jgi:hypothetical protein